MKVQINSKQYSLKQVDETLISDFTNLFNETKKQKVHPSYFLNKYSNTPGNSFYFGFLLYFENKAVAHFGCIPYIEEFQGKVVKFGQLCDTVTHPEFQNNGLNKFLTEHLLDFLKGKEFDFVFSFANPRSSKIKIEKFNWNHVDDFYTYTIPAKSLLLNKISNKLKLVKLYELYISFLCLFFSRQAKFPTKGNSLEITHNEAYLKYKTYRKNYCINISKHLLWFNIEDGIQIAYSTIKNEHDFKVVMKRLKLFCFFAGFHKIKIVFSEKNNQYTWLDKSISEFTIPLVVKKININVDLNSFVLYYADKNTF